MRPYLTATALVISTASLAACGGGNKEDNQVTQTRMDDIDSLEGTISDDMINTDESTDEAPVDAAPAADSKPAANDDKKKTDKAKEPEPAKTDDKAAAE
jgi:hypothetical protein